MVTQPWLLLDLNPSFLCSVAMADQTYSLVFQLSTIKIPVGIILTSSVHLIGTQGSYAIAVYAPFKGQIIVCYLAADELILAWIYEDNPSAVWSGTKVYLNILGP